MNRASYTHTHTPGVPEERRENRAGKKKPMRK